MKVVMQDGIKDCGICCLLSIIRFYGGEVSKEYLREITNTTKDGVTLFNLIEGAKRIGFNAEGVSGKLEDINVDNLPFIAHFIVNNRFKHFVVIYKINNNKKLVTIMDPAKGKKVISFSEFNLLSSSNYLLLKPIKELPKMNNKNIIYKNIKNNIKNNRKIIVIITILTLTHILFSIITSLNLKYLVEYSINYNISENIKRITSIIILFYIMKNTNMFIRNILITKFNLLLDYETSTSTYKQILHLPYLYFKNRTTGEVISRFKDLNTIRTYLTTLFSTLITDVLSIIIFLTIMYIYNKTLTFLISIIIFILFIYTLSIKKYKRKIIKDISINEDTINSYIIQGISNVDTIKGSHLEKRLTDKYTYKYKTYTESIYKYINFNNIDSYIRDNVSDLILIIVYSLGSLYVVRGKISLSNLIIYQSFLNYFSSSTIRIVNLLEEYHSYKIAKDRVEELFLIDSETFHNNYFFISYSLNGDIIINNLSYRLGTRKLLNNINLEIKKGEKILLYGESGTGKSTLMKMLLRYIEVDFNHIKISNIDINHYHLENIRKNITYLTSNEYLFNDTIKNNITLYKEYKDEEIDKIIELTHTKEILDNNSLSLNSLIEENGINFSNGERQRIILSRALLRNSNIYILDEALSQIDIEKEKSILKNIFKYLNDKTVIIVSHRFNNKNLFDRVLKLESGNIIEDKKL